MKLLKRVFDFILFRYNPYPLEIRKKSGLFLCIIMLSALILALMTATELYFSMPFISILPLLTGFTGLLVILVVLHSGRFLTAVSLFYFLFYIFIIMVTYLDPFDTAFELYRFTFILSFLVLITSAISTKAYSHIILMISGDLNIILLYIMKFHIKLNMVGDKLVLQTFVSCLLLYTAFCFIGYLIFMVTKQVITIANTNADRARLQRDSYGRFVPRQFLSILDKESITDVNLGDHIERTMTVMFCDIRQFTSLSEAMNPQENFDFLNSYLSRMEPVIHEHNGFIDKYIGDSIMTLFPGDADDALLCSVQMMKKLQEYNKGRIEYGYRPIRIGIGINTGLLMLGTIGGQNRMDSTVISDNVNTASRIENLTKRLGASILFTKNTFISALNISNHNYRYLGTMRVKGKSNTVSIYELLDGLPEEEFNLKMEHIREFEEGTLLFYKGDSRGARRVFKKLFRECPGDRAVEMYYNFLMSLKSKKYSGESNFFVTRENL